jgi:hypothetical protein
MGSKQIALTECKHIAETYGYTHVRIIAYDFGDDYKTCGNVCDIHIGQRWWALPMTSWIIRKMRRWL